MAGSIPLRLGGTVCLSITGLRILKQMQCEKNKEIRKRKSHSSRVYWQTIGAPMSAAKFPHHLFRILRPLPYHVRSAIFRFQRTVERSHVIHTLVEKVIAILRKSEKAVVIWLRVY